VVQFEGKKHESDQVHQDKLSIAQEVKLQMRSSRQAKEAKGCGRIILQELLILSSIRNEPHNPGYCDKVARAIRKVVVDEAHYITEDGEADGLVES